MSLVIRAAARMLPAAIRDRYREEWLADARDAAEAGLRPSEIALAAVTFVVSAPRPLERRRRVPDPAARARLGAALALTCAVLGISQFAPATGGLSTSTGYNIVVFLGTSFLLLYLLLAPIVALVLIAGRGVGWRVRLAVPLLILASMAGVLYGSLNGIRASLPTGTPLLVESSVVIAVALGFAVIACALLALGAPRAAPQGRRLRGALISTTLLLAALALGLANVVSLQQQLRAADIVFVHDMVQIGQLDGAEAMLAQSQQATTAAIAAWAGIAALLIVAGGLLAYRWPRHTVARALALLFALMITHAGLLTFVWLNSFGGPGVHLTVPEAVLLLVGRWGLVAVVLYSVGGVRLSRVGHRHDVEGRVELL